MKKLHLVVLHWDQLPCIGISCHASGKIPLRYSWVLNLLPPALLTLRSRRVFSLNICFLFLNLCLCEACVSKNDQHFVLRRQAPWWALWNFAMIFKRLKPSLEMSWNWTKFKSHAIWHAYLRCSHFKCIIKIFNLMIIVGDTHDWLLVIVF